MKSTVLLVFLPALFATPRRADANCAPNRWPNAPRTINVHVQSRSFSTRGLLCPRSGRLHFDDTDLRAVIRRALESWNHEGGSGVRLALVEQSTDLPAIADAIVISGVCANGPPQCRNCPLMSTHTTLRTAQSPFPRPFRGRGIITSASITVDISHYAWATDWPVSGPDMQAHFTKQFGRALGFADTYDPRNPQCSIGPAGNSVLSFAAVSDSYLLRAIQDPASAAVVPRGPNGGRHLWNQDIRGLQDSPVLGYGSFTGATLHQRVTFDQTTWFPAFATPDITSTTSPAATALPLGGFVLASVSADASHSIGILTYLNPTREQTRFHSYVGPALAATGPDVGPTRVHMVWVSDDDERYLLYANAVFDGASLIWSDAMPVTYLDASGSTAIATTHSTPALAVAANVLVLAWVDRRDDSLHAVGTDGNGSVSSGVPDPQSPQFIGHDILLDPSTVAPQSLPATGLSVSCTAPFLPAVTPPPSGINPNTSICQVFYGANTARRTAAALPFEAMFIPPTDNLPQPLFQTVLAALPTLSTQSQIGVAGSTFVPPAFSTPCAVGAFPYGGEWIDVFSNLSDLLLSGVTSTTLFDCDLRDFDRLQTVGGTAVISDPFDPILPSIRTFYFSAQ